MHMCACKHNSEMFSHYCVCLKCWGSGKIIQNDQFNQVIFFFWLLELFLYLLISCTGSSSKARVFSSYFRRIEDYLQRDGRDFLFSVLKRTINSQRHQFVLVGDVAHQQVNQEKERTDIV